MDIRTFINNYFWLLLIILVILKMIVIWFRMSRVIRKKPELRHDAEIFIRGYLFYFSVPLLLIWILQRAGDFTSPLYMFSHETTNIFIFTSWLIIIFSWVVLILWVYLQHGAEFLVQFKKVFKLLPSSEKGIKIGILVLIGICLAGFVTGIILNLGALSLF